MSDPQEQEQEQSVETFHLGSLTEDLIAEDRSDEEDGKHRC